MSSPELRAHTLAKVGAFLIELTKDTSLPPIVSLKAGRLLREYPTSFTVRYSPIARAAEQLSYPHLDISAVVEPHWASDNSGARMGPWTPLDVRERTPEPEGRKQRPRKKAPAR